MVASPVESRDTPGIFATMGELAMESQIRRGGVFKGDQIRIV